MSETKNECEIVNRLSRKVEKELSENMDKVNEDITEINEKLEDVAVIDDSTETTTTTWSSSKIKEEIDAGGGSESDGFKLTYMNAPTLSKVQNVATYTH
jgi:endo-alpha-1,4-polygalactosaminidase (GH114 family)